MSHDINKLVGDYINMRDYKAEVGEKQKTEMARINKVMSKIEGLLRSKMEELGVESLRTDAGLCHKYVKTSTKVEDREAYMQFVIDTGSWEFLESKANKTAVVEYVNEHGTLPPGVTVFRFETVRIVR